MAVGGGAARGAVFPLTAFGIVLTAVAAAGLVVAEVRDSPLRLVAKPLASAGFLLTAVAVGPFGSGYGRWLLAGLVLGAAGDVLLLWDRTFLPGLAAFLLGHVAYVIAFLVVGLAWTWVALAGVGAGVLAIGVTRWLGPHLPRALAGAVRAYVVVITLMVAVAFGAAGTGFDRRALAGVLSFFVSDLAVARDRFVAPGWANRLWGLPLYYAGQTLLALTAGTQPTG